MAVLLENTMSPLLLLLLFLIELGFSLAPLEVESSKIMLGCWWDRLNKQRPMMINERLQVKPLSLWTSDVNISSTLQVDHWDEIVAQIKETKTNAGIYITVYPMEGFDKVSDNAVSQLISKVKEITDGGGKIFIRYAPEMNGSWFRYGQLPSQFIASWRRVVKAVRDAAGKDNIAFIWGPNSVYGYPFKGNDHSKDVGNPNYESILDTNGNGEYDNGDDPYSPFYPGDEWVWHF